MNKKIIIDANFLNETRVVLLNNNNIDYIEYETSIKQQNKGNIYLAQVTRVEPSLQAAFIEYGGEKSGFLPFTEIHKDYYNFSSLETKDLAHIESLKSIEIADLTSENLTEVEVLKDYRAIIENDEIDLKAIERLVDEKIQSELAIEILESDLDSVVLEEEANLGKEKHYKIQEVIKKGQLLLVQVIKEERGNKGASFTTFISLAGKYCVLMANSAMQNGVSRKISNSDERKRLKGIIGKIANDTASIIVRTAGIGRSTLEITRDYNYLVNLWNNIRQIALSLNTPCFIHEEEGLIQKIIRDMFDHSVKEVIIQGNEAYHEAVRFVKDILPNEINKIKEYKNKVPIFTKFGIESQLSDLYQPIISLTSGGYIVINPTEALIAIDVNSGKATSEQNIEETALKTNLEAAKEIARQVKLRDLSGLVVIDFIDMYDTRNRRIIERSFREFLIRDRARIQIGSISQFGLLEMSRQRLKPSFLEANSSICCYCNGKGIVRADESNAMLILRTVENEILNESIDLIKVYANNQSIVYILNRKREEILLIEKKYNITLNFYIDSNATSDNFSIEKVKLSKKENNIIHIKPLIQNQSLTYQEQKSYKKKFNTKAKIKVKTSDSNILESSNNLGVSGTLLRKEVIENEILNLENNSINLDNDISSNDIKAEDISNAEKNPEINKKLKKTSFLTKKKKTFNKKSRMQLENINKENQLVKNDDFSL